MRKPAKSIILKKSEFIPPDMAQDPSLSVDNPEIINRPLVFVGRPLTRDEMYEIKDLTHVEGRDSLTAEEQVAIDANDIGSPAFSSALNKIRFKNDGKVVKYIYDRCISEIRNVLIGDEKFESMVGAKDKQKFWNTIGNEKEIEQASAHFMKLASVEEDDSKN